MLEQSHISAIIAVKVSVVLNISITNVMKNNVPSSIQLYKVTVKAILFKTKAITLESTCMYGILKLI